MCQAYRRKENFLNTVKDLFDLSCKLYNGVPHLEESALKLEIVRDKKDNDWPFNTRGIISNFKNLRALKLSF